MLTIHLPQAFVERMKRLLGEEYESFANSYDLDRYYGLRVNTLKISSDEFLSKSPFHLSPIPWTPQGFYYEREDRPGKHPYYHAGLYYIQEPSAMAPAEMIGVRPGDRVLDLCAAPGGKSTQLACKLENRGVLVSNDISSDRCKALVKNIELAGVRQAVVLNESPERLALTFNSYFDKILIDAPCSGEGMFRKDENMTKAWDVHSVEQCVLLQRDILLQAAQMLAAGGRIMYSTCTFSPQEDEGMIAEFLHRHRDFRIVPIEPRHGFESGRPEWISGMRVDEAAVDRETIASVAGTVRLWPHRLRGEGHFMALLERTGDPLVENVPAQRETAVSNSKSGRVRSKRGKQDILSDRNAVEDALQKFAKKELRVDLDGSIVKYADHVYLSPPDVPPLDGLKVARPGWYLGIVKRDRFVPSQALAMGLSSEDAARVIDLPADSDEIVRYLRGETLSIDKETVRLNNEAAAKGLCLVCVDGFPVGWGKWHNQMLKNEYPAGWRRF